ncbi:MAG: PAS domain S-box protein, partial [Caldilineaceae bacterium]|nr:PAS domain S-box protein [Caldilineaceae bacterium]
MSQTDATRHDAQTELTKARQRIAELEKQLEQARSVTGVEYQRLLIDSIPDALFILSYDETTDTHQVVDVNESTCNLLGYERDELLKLTIQDIDDPASPVGPPDMFERMRSGAPVVFERIHRRRDGSTLPVEVHARVGEIRGRQVIISVVRDIARRKTMEQDLRRFEAAIRQTEDAV